MWSMKCVIWFTLDSTIIIEGCRKMRVYNYLFHLFCTVRLQLTLMLYYISGLMWQNQVSFFPLPYNFPADMMWLHYLWRKINDENTWPIFFTWIKLNFCLIPIKLVFDMEKTYKRLNSPKSNKNTPSTASFKSAK